MALLLFLNDIEGVTDEAYTAWHRDHHVLQRLTVPGIQAGHRYEKVTGRGRRFLTVYELASQNALSHPAYLSLVAEPDTQTVLMRPHLRHGVRVVLALDRQLSAPPPSKLMILDNPKPNSAWAEGVLQQAPTIHPLATQVSLPARLQLIDASQLRDSHPVQSGLSEPMPWDGTYGSV
jgi:hypothetical protein